MPVPEVGPKADPEFFEEIQELFKKHPEAAKKYSIRFVGGEIAALKLDFDQTVGLSRLEGNQLVTEFVDRATLIQNESGGGFEEEEVLGEESARFCCEWVVIGNRRKCIRICS
ncbi:hypothetical protein AB0M92_24290 [Streptomyces sp. NPDC051582]|uniref:hypothetical protein n=1 Tax=Streptomyces sp. NPDC051582 TaxID=3155167 RepID=UPI003432C43A